MKKLIFGIVFILLFLTPKNVKSIESPLVLNIVYRGQAELINHKPYLIKSGKSKKGKVSVVARDVPMAILDTEKNEIIIIRATVSVERDVYINGRIEKIVDVKNVRPADFYVVKNNGNGINTSFYVTRNGKYYPFLGWHYIKHDNGETLVYSPYSDFFALPDVISFGREYLMSAITLGNEDLKGLRVFSRAIDDRFIADVIPVRLIANLALIEHMDHNEYEDMGEVYMTNKVLTQFALNRENTFSYSRSSVGALCLMQIMRTTYGGSRSKKGKLAPGVLQLYPLARLPVNPVAGSCDSHSGAAKVAALVLDDKLASMPEDFLNQFSDDPKRFGYVLAAAYNGGASRAIRIYRHVGEPRIFELIKNLFSYLTHGRSDFREYNLLREETWIFVKKYFEVDKELHKK